MKLSSSRTRNKTYEETTRDAKEVATNILSTCDTLLNLVLWVADNAVPVSDHMSSKKIKETNDVITKKMFDNIYRVFVDTTNTWEKLGGDISIDIYYTNNVVFYRNNDPSTPIAVSIENDYMVYFYPPKDLDSVMFFLLNPKIEEEAINILRAIELNQEAQMALLDYRAIVEKIPRNISDIEITIKDITVPTDAYTIIVFPRRMGTERVVMMEAYTDEESDDIYYRISLQVDESTVAYTISKENRTKALQLLLEKFVPRKELRMLKRWMSNILSASLKAYIIMGAMKKMTEEETD